MARIDSVRRMVPASSGVHLDAHLVSLYAHLPACAVFVVLLAQGCVKPVRSGPREEFHVRVDEHVDGVGRIQCGGRSSTAGGVYLRFWPERAGRVVDPAAWPVAGIFDGVEVSVSPYVWGSFQGVMYCGLPQERPMVDVASGEVVTYRGLHGMGTADRLRCGVWMDGQLHWTAWVDLTSEDEP